MSNDEKYYGKYDKNISPVGWYVGSYLLRFIEIEDTDNQNLNRCYTAWENTIILQADNLDDAYDTLVEHVRMETEPYKGGLEAIPVKWEFEGVTQLMPIYEKLEHGTEIMYEEYENRQLKTLRKWVRSKGEFSQ